ncbi:MAG: M48 family metallopeptidase [Alphaproteobacteria bacterium]
MADKFPATFVDEKTGDIRKFRTTWDKVEDSLPDVAHYGLLAAKISLLAPLIGGALVAAPAAVALWWGTRTAMKKSMDSVHDGLLQQHRQGEFSEYDLTKEEDRKAFDARFGDLQPQFADDYLKMAKLAHLEQVPKLMVIEPYFREQGRSRFAGMISDFMAAATSRPNGKDPVVLLGRGAMKELTPEEMRAVVGHELTHVKLKHMTETANWLGRLSMSGVINAGLLGAALLGGLPILPVLGLIAVTNVIGTCLKSMQSRKHEKLCDRGAAILTGGTKDLSSALGKIRSAMIKIKQMEVDEEFRARGMDPPKVREVGGMTRFINATHPPNEQREKLLNNFENTYPEFCKKQRGLFAAAFNKAAKPKTQKPLFAPKPKPKPKEPKIKYLKPINWGFGYR